MRWNFLVSCAALGILLGGSAGVQAEAITERGCNGVMSDAEVVEVAEGHMYIHLQSEWTGHMTEDPDSLLFGTAGTSFGSIEVQDGTVSGSGYTELVDLEGNEQILSWEVTGFTEAGDFAGTWELVRGDGVWVGATASGTWESMPQAMPDRYINCWEGEVELADS